MLVPVGSGLAACDIGPLLLARQIQTERMTVERLRLARYWLGPQFRDQL